MARPASCRFAFHGRRPGARRRAAGRGPGAQQRGRRLDERRRSTRPDRFDRRAAEVRARRAAWQPSAGMESRLMPWWGWLLVGLGLAWVLGALWLWALVVAGARADENTERILKRERAERDG